MAVGSTLALDPLPRAGPAAEIVVPRDTPKTSHNLREPYPMGGICGLRLSGVVPRLPGIQKTRASAPHELDRIEPLSQL